MRKVAKSVENVEFSCNITSLLSAEVTARIKAAFSVKIRDQGPDYRCFVTECDKGVYNCYYKECQMVESARQRSQQQTGKLSCSLFVSSMSNFSTRGTHMQAHRKGNLPWIPSFYPNGT